MNPKPIKVKFYSRQLLPMLIDGDNLRNWVIETATPEQLRFLNKTRWTSIYSHTDRSVYLIIAVDSEKDVTLANIYFG